MNFVKLLGGKCGTCQSVSFKYFWMFYSFKCLQVSFFGSTENEEAFDILYCIAYEMMDAQWLAMHASYMDFNVFFLSLCFLHFHYFPFYASNSFSHTHTRTKKKNILQEQPSLFPLGWVGLMDHHKAL